MSKYFEITTSGNIPYKISHMINEIKKISDKYVRTVAEIFVERAKEKLINTYDEYNTAHLAENIYCQRARGQGNYRVGLKSNDKKEIMFYLEFGTGVVGKANPHQSTVKKNDNGEIINEFDWYYVERPKKIEWDYDKFTGIRRKKDGSGSWVYKDGKPYGWYFFDKKLGRINFTSGLKAISYMYNTLLELDDIKLEAERRIKNGK